MSLKSTTPKQTSDTSRLKSRVKICLAMVVANERLVIERCLNSLENIIDEICISINEDNDGTQECIENWGRQRNIPTTVWFDPWRGYGPTKTRNLLKIKEEIDTDYIIFIDADEVFVTDPKNPLSYVTKEEAIKLKKELDDDKNADVFFMKTHYGKYIYSRWQIVKNNQVWIWHLPYQECLVGEKSNNRHDINWIYNYVRHDGHSSRHPDDLNKNIKLLENWAKENPESDFLSRAYFYLGQAYYESNNNEKGIYYLEKRLGLNGWDQENYIASYYLANIYERLKKPEERKRCLIRCTEIDGSRLEAYYHLMMDGYNKSEYKEGISWAIKAPGSRNKPCNKFLLNELLYDYKFDFELAGGAYHAAIKNKYDSYENNALFHLGLDALDRCEHTTPGRLKELWNSNKNHYLRKIKADLGHIKKQTSPTLIVVDNFYDNPDEIRNLALNMEYNISGNYPGARTKPYYIDGIKNKLEYYTNNKITYWPDTYNGSFQYTTKNDKSWIHRDKTEWSVVVYLTPNAPLNAGTKMFKHKETGLTSSLGNEDNEKILNMDSYDHDKWDVVDKIGNVYNRAIFFKGLKTHMSDEYFGDNLENGRLFQTFFFNC